MGAVWICLGAEAGQDEVEEEEEEEEVVGDEE